MKHKVDQSLIWLERVSKNGYQNLMRNKILTAATVLIISLMFFVFNLILALSYASDSVTLSIGRKVDIRAEILPDVEDYTIQTLVGRLKEQSYVEEVVFIGKAEALQSFGERYPNVITFLENNRLQNPLPNVVRVIGKDISANEKIVDFLEKSQYSRIVDQEKLKSDTEQKSRNEKVLSITRFINGIGLWLNLVFAIVAILIIFNSININIHSHRHEIHIMQLVGAKLNFIRGGYLFQGLAYAVMALFLSLIFSRLTLLYLSKNLLGVISNESLLVGLDAILLHFEDHFWWTVTWEFFGVVAVGLLSSFLAIELYLRKRFIF
jgi:cell division transport system permease protein